MSDILELPVESGGGSSNSFSVIQPDTGTSPAASSPTDTLTFTSSDSSISVDGNSTTDTIDLTTAKPSWSSFTPVLTGGGSLTYTTSNARYYITGKILYMYFDWVQTLAGSGASILSAAIPGGVTVLDQGNVGTMTAIDMGNNNIYNQFGVKADNATNKLQFYRTDATTLILGGSNIGNNGFGRHVAVIAPLA